MLFLRFRPHLEEEKEAYRLTRQACLMDGPLGPCEALGMGLAMVFGLDAIRISNVFVASMEKCGPYDVRAVDFAQPLRPEHTEARTRYC